jgi:hypothetical protein
MNAPMPTPPGRHPSDDREPAPDGGATVSSAAPSKPVATEPDDEDDGYEPV